MRTFYQVRTEPQNPEDAEQKTIGIKLDIIQDIVVLGSAENDSAVQITTRLTNLLSNNSAPAGVRYLWDFQIGKDDGPEFRDSDDKKGVNFEQEFLHPTFSEFTILENDFIATNKDGKKERAFLVKGSANTKGFGLSTTTPKKLTSACWEKTSKTDYKYKIDKNRKINSQDAVNCGGDNSVLYYFGETEFTNQYYDNINPQETQIVSAAIFAEPGHIIEADKTDTDKDGLWDVWEREGGVDLNDNGKIDIDEKFNVPVKYNHKDIIIYYDWTNSEVSAVKESQEKSNSNQADKDKYKPEEASLKLVAEAFKNAPVNNADGKSGITVHFIAGSEVKIKNKEMLGSWEDDNYDWSEFAEIKAKNLPKRLWPAAHYALFTSQHNPQKSSGISRNPDWNFGSGASDFLISIGSWEYN